MMKERLLSAITKAAAEFIARESNGRSLVTVTRAVLDRDGTHVTVYFSAYPNRDTHAVTDFLTRRTGDFVAYLRTRASMRAIPRIRFLPEPERDIVQ